MRGSAILAILVLSYGSGCCCYPSRELDTVRVNAEVNAYRVAEWMQNETTKYRCRNEMQSAALKEYLSIGWCNGWCFAPICCEPAMCDVSCSNACEPLISYPLPTYSQPTVGQGLPYPLTGRYLPAGNAQPAAPVMAGMVPQQPQVSSSGWHPTPVP